ncbi:hypothetical protein DPMN_171247 [Dreissena polymorpha]|uniref:DZIP3-like HEPN domain-containing protein n=1 Tax=Dreissena polymorpha TaxID=45954 RepID=A0A9D4IFE0_DREPO|nr:hypothetical protein DPMN_171247 [Dreissena polymorpha]
MGPMAFLPAWLKLSMRICAVCSEAMLTDRLQELKNEGVFTEDEVNILNQSPVNLDKFDIRLICLLLQHLTPDSNSASYSASSQGGLAIPDDDDFSILAELRRIQICKNQIMYQRTRVVDDDEFDQLFSEILDTCIRILKQAKSSKEDVTAMRKKMNALKNSKMEDIKGNIQENVLQCVRWSAGDMDGIQTRLAGVQIKMASSEKYDEVDASRLDNLSHLQEEVSSLTTEVQALTIEEGSKNEAARFTEEQSVVQQVETSRQQLAAACETMQENILNLLSRAPIEKDDSFESNTEGCGVGQQQRPNQHNMPMGVRSSTVEETELLAVCAEIDPVELHKLRINLDFEMAQMTRLEEAYRHFDERIFAMLKAWHDTVISCEQNPRHLLAVALEDSGNRLLAIKLVPGEELDRIVQRRAHENTKKCIKKITFSKPQENQGQGVMMNYGATEAINVFSGGELVIGGTMTIGTDNIDWRLPSAASSWSTGLSGPAGSRSDLPPGLSGPAGSRSDLPPGLSGPAGSRSDLRPTSSSASIHNFAQPHSLNIMGGRVTTTPGSHIALGPNMSMWSSPSRVGSAKGDSTDSVPNRHGHLKKEFDDSLSQTMMDIYLQNMKSVGAIMCFNQTYGTGFRVGTKYIATAKHVISTILDPRRSGKENISHLQQASIVFSDLPNEPSATKYYFSQFYYYDQELDVAVLEISNADGMMPRGLRLRKEFFCRADTDIVSIVGYGHPNQKNQNKYFEYRCPVVDSDSQAVCAAQAFVRQKQAVLKNGLLKGYPFSVVDAGYKGYDAPYRMLLHCFMEHGASGSPILACINPSAGIVEVVGVLTCGMPDFFFCLKQEFRYLIPSKYRFEAGSRMSAIYESMKVYQKQDLAADLFV